MRRALGFCSRHFLFQHHLIPAQTFYADGVSPWENSTKATLGLCSVRPVRFFSEVRSHYGHSEENPALSKPSKSPFLENLLVCSSPSDVLDLTSRLAPTLHQVSQCLSQMWRSTKKMSEEQRRYEQQLMFEHAAFEKLLQQAMSGLRYMTNENLAYSLLAIVKLGVSPQTRVVQTFLRACQERINDFDEKSLSILASCLENLEDSSNVKALKDGMRILVEARLPRINNVIHFQTMMRLVGKDAPLELKRKLESKALSMSDQFSLPNAQYMVSTMAAVGFYSKPLLSVCSRKISETLSGIPFNRLLNVLVSCKELLYRDLQMLKNVSEYAASMVDVWSNKQVMMLLSVLESLSFCPSALMEAYSEKVLSNPESLTLKDLLCVLKVYSSLNYDLQQHTHRFLETLTKALEPYLLKMSPPQLLKAVYCFCLMGHFPPAPLQLLLQNSTVQQLQTKELRFIHTQFQTLDLCLRLDRPVLPEPLSVPGSVLPVGLRPSAPSPRCSAALQTLRENLEGWTLQETEPLDDCYHIDAVLIKNVSSSETGESSAAEGSQRIAVLCVPPSRFCYGTSHPRGLLALKLRHLRILGYEPVLIPEQELLSVSEDTRADFLRERVFTDKSISNTRHDLEQT